jgi:predicted phage terminase large subunit-like protein
VSATLASAGIELDPRALQAARLAYRELCKRHLAFFLREAWHVIEPATPLRWNWHIDAVCTALEAVTRGEVRRLAINIPPGTMKSIIVSVIWPAWIWTREPGWRGLFASYAEDLALRDSVRCRNVVSSEWYRQTFDPGWGLAGDQNVKSYFENTEHGFRLSLSVGGAGTGFRGDAVIVDDPLNVKKASSEPARREAFDWWTKTMPTRVNDPETGKFVIVMQRLHEDDLTGHMLRRGGYVHLSLPSEYEPDVKCACGLQPCSSGPLGKLDPRTKAGELLFPSMFTPEVLAELRKDLGSSGYAGQHQQRPMPASGGMIKRGWFQRWRELPALDEAIQSWDCTFKAGDETDFVVGQVWGRAGVKRYLIDQVRGRMGVVETMQAIRDLSKKWPKARLKIIEDKANGPAVIEILKKEIDGIVPVNPGKDSKESRAAAVTPTLEAGNVFIPAEADWASDFIEECAAFPKGSHDDQVDAMTQALLRFASTRRVVAAFS